MMELGFTLQVRAYFISLLIVHLPAEHVLQGLGVAARAVPPPRVAPPVGARLDKLLALLVDVQHLPDANHGVFTLKHLLVLLERFHVHGFAVRVQSVQQRLPHVIRRSAHLVYVKVRRVDILVDATGDASHVRGLCEVVPVETRESRGPDQHVIREVPDDVVPFQLWGDEALPEQRDVLVVPRVSVGDGGPVAQAVDLVPVVPPRHDP
mmetsp:Transcript_14001/g.38322  ORF Transcript_14001/g.38322 Transcript_14001/m.38322 type:complete len:208 (+) Transcript_14001:16-639(+)